jgi:hypothetical protein
MNNWPCGFSPFPVAAFQTSAFQTSVFLRVLCGSFRPFQSADSIHQSIDSVFQVYDIEIDQ